jgi:hypothetical protein
MNETGSANTSVTVPGTDTSLELGDISASIAAELASELSTPEDIRKRYGFTKGQWDRLKSNPMFRGMVTDAIKTFRGPLAAGARITKKAEIMLEDTLPDLYQIVKSHETPTGERIKAVQTLAELSGRGKKDNPDAGGKAPGFTLNINIPGGAPVTIQGSSRGSNSDV